MESVILQSGFILTGFETWETLPAHPLCHFSHLQNGGTNQVMIQVSQTSKTARVNEAISGPCTHPVFPSLPPARPPPHSLSMPCTVTIQVYSGVSIEVLRNRSTPWGGSTSEIGAFGPHALGVEGCFLMGECLEPYQEGGHIGWQVSIVSFPKHT